MKAVIFDFDGTLTKSRKGSNCWYEVWKYLDDLKYDDYLYGMYKHKEINDQQWFDLIVKRYIEKGVKRQYLTEIANTIEVIDGAQQTLKILHDNGVKVFILSGGIRQIIEDILEREQIREYITAIESYDLLFDKEGNLTGFQRPKSHNPENKNECVDLIKREYRLAKDDVLFVGNGANDEKVYLSGVDTLCINPDDADITNQTVWHHSIENCENLSQILEFCGLGKERVKCEKTY